MGQLGWVSSTGSIFKLKIKCMCVGLNILSNVLGGSARPAQYTIITIPDLFIFTLMF